MNFNHFTGLNRPATNANEAECEAKPTREDKGEEFDKKPKGHPVPKPGTYLGAQTSGYSAQGVYGALNVVNPVIRRNTQDFVASRFLSKSCDATRWLEAGWAEVGWFNDDQYIYTFDSVSNQWRFFTQYPIGPGSQVWFQIYDWGNKWEAWLWWNGAWQVLTSVNIDGLNCTENFTEIKSTESGPGRVLFPSIHHSSGALGSVQIADSNGQFQNWDSSISSQSYNTDGSGIYYARPISLYWDFYVESLRIIEGNDHSNGPAISSSGRYVAFASRANNLVADDTNSAVAAWDVFVRDRSSGATHRVSVSSQGEEADGSSAELGTAISADGRWVVYESSATNLVGDDTNGVSDIFRHDLQFRSTQRVSQGPNFVAQSNGASAGPDISDEGRYTSFSSMATNLIASDTNGAWDVFRRDPQTGSTQLVSQSSAGAQGNATSNQAKMNGTGQWIAFTSHATNLVGNDANGVSDVFLRDVTNGTTIAVSVSGGQTANGSSDVPDISTTGRYVTYGSSATNIAGSDGNGQPDVFIWDRDTGSQRLVSVSTDGSTSGNGWSGFPSISGDGRYVAFWSRASNLVSGDTNGLADIFVRDLNTNVTVRLTGGDGWQANGESYVPMTQDGQFVAFASEATNLVAYDNNARRDIFTAKVSPFQLTRDSVGTFNSAPFVPFSVTPSQGDTNTTFQASMAQAWDLEEDSMTFQIEWGDGSTTSGQTGTHRYTSPGSYVVVGTATDQFNASSSNSVVVTVCAAAAQNQCASGNPGVGPGQVCDQAGVCVEQPSDVAGQPLPTTSPLPDDVGAMAAQESLVFISANLGNGDESPRPAKFADRVKDLTHKSRSLDSSFKDGIGGNIPDLILLQEVTCSVAAQVRDELNAARNFGNSAGPFKRPACGSSSSGQSSDTAILFNSDSLEFERKFMARTTHSASDIGVASFVDTDTGELIGCPTGTTSRGHWMARFIKKPATEGIVTVASTHFIPRGCLADNINKEDRYKTWADEIASAINNFGSGSAFYVAGGDFNNHRCDPHVPTREFGDCANEEYPAGQERPWWRALHRREPANPNRNFLDTIFVKHCPSSTTCDANLRKQHRDGWIQRSVTHNYRNKRIDYIFVRSATEIVAASHDLSCGIFETPPNCTDESNPARYSDHRLVWAIIR